jgi:N-methylhydantoinase B
LNPRDAVTAGLQADDLVEIDARQAAPLRAWLRIDPSIEVGTLPIDQVGLTILKVSPGQRLEVRRIATVILPQERLAEAAE